MALPNQNQLQHSARMCLRAIAVSMLNFNILLIGISLYKDVEYIKK